MDEIKQKAEELKLAVYYVKEDCSPHAPEIPFSVDEAITALLAAIDVA
jgi:hypothetical protein